MYQHVLEGMDALEIAVINVYHISNTIFEIDTDLIFLNRPQSCSRRIVAAQSSFILISLTATTNLGMNSLRHLYSTSLGSSMSSSLSRHVIRLSGRLFR